MAAGDTFEVIRSTDQLIFDSSGNVTGIRNPRAVGNDLSIAQILQIAFGALPSSGTDSGATANGTGYAPGDLITLTGGTATRAAKVIVNWTQAISATVASAGSGGVDGAVTVSGTTGTGTVCQFSGTIVSGALTGPLTLVTAGQYTVNPTTPAAEPVTGGSLVGATINVVLGVLSWGIAEFGSYTSLPSNPVAQGSTTGSGTGATFNLVWGPVAAGIGYGWELGGSSNVFLGGKAGSAQSLAGGVCYGAENTYIGAYAGARATSGKFNTALGHNAYGIGAGVAVTGSSNTAIGCDSMRNVVGTSSWTAVGTSALKGASTATGAANTAVGQNAMGGSGLTSASNNTAVGNNALSSNSLTSASFNVAIGDNALPALQTGGPNTGVGRLSGQALTTGSNNTLIGNQAFSTATSTNDSTAVGHQAGLKITGAQNVIVGSKAAGGATGGAAANSVIVGYNAANLLTTGVQNVVIGPSVASTTLTTGARNILIGNSSAIDTAAAGTNDSLNIGGLVVGDMATGGAFGYGTGHGATVSQGTSRATGVTLDAACGEITLFSAAGSATAASFTVSNSKVAATDQIIPNVKSSTNKYLVFITAKAAGSFEITFQTTGGTAVDAPVFSFTVIKGVAT
jgi:hypothetical protein